MLFFIPSVSAFGFHLSIFLNNHALYLLAAGPRFFTHRIGVTRRDQGVRNVFGMEVVFLEGDEVVG